MAGLEMACSCGQPALKDTDLGMDDLMRIKAYVDEHKNHRSLVITVTAGNPGADR